MQDQRQLWRASTPKRRGRRVLVWLGGAMAVLLGLMLLGALYESIAEASDQRAYSPPGQMVDVGGFRLNISCVGTDSPTVVIDVGWGDTSSSWSSWVQPEVAKTTRVCTYDRAGIGFSEAGPLPRSAKQFAQELHTLLHKGEVPGPYVVLGHSMGGLTARVFAHDYAGEVAGVVLIESMSPSSAKPSASGTSEASPQDDGQSTVDWLLTLPARIGLVRLLSGPSSASTAFTVTPRASQTVIDEGRGMPAGLAQAGAVKSLGSVPLIVLSRGPDQDQDWQKMQTEMLQLSANSKQLFAEKSGHNVQFDQPEAAVGAIVQMVEQIRRQ
jgi:pimeloyl-ACP methyl ester carboxylesterase